MGFDDLLSEEEKDRIRAIIAALENLGFNDVKTVSLLIAGYDEPSPSRSGRVS